MAGRLMLRAALVAGFTLWAKVVMNEQAREWHEKGVSWLHGKDTVEYARWYLTGIEHGTQPLAAGLCAYCGSYVFGHLGETTRNSNRRAGEPRGPDGTKCAFDAQPPFLERYTPAAFARWCPSHFAHSPDTNKLSLRPGKTAPWMLKASLDTKRRQTEWHYCSDCYDTLFTEHGAKIPFRDRETAEKDNLEVHATAGDIPKEARARWEKAEKSASRANGKRFTEKNLVPTPKPAKWQDVPGVPLSAITSDEALSLVSGMHIMADITPARYENVARHAYAGGEPTDVRAFHACAP
eukprot:gene30377-19232_t